MKNATPRQVAKSLLNKGWVSTDLFSCIRRKIKNPITAMIIPMPSPNINESLVVTYCFLGSYLIYDLLVFGFFFEFDNL